MATQSFDCSSSKNDEDVDSTWLQGNSLERKKEEPKQFFFRDNAT